MDALEIADRHQEEFGDASRDHLDHFVRITNEKRSEYATGRTAGREGSL